MKNKRLLIFTTMVCVLFVAACTKKPDKLLTMKSGMWFCDITTVTVYNVTNEPTSIVNSFSKFEFFENGTGSDSLEFAMGLHFANNLFAALFVNYKSSVFQTDAVFTLKEINFSPATQAMGVLGAVIFILLIHLKYPLKPLRMLWTKDELNTP